MLCALEGTVMEINNNIELTVQGFIKWIRNLNLGHKRLWFIISIIWFFSIIIPNIYEYNKNIKYCNTAEKDIIYIAANLGSVSAKTYKKCNVKITKVKALGSNPRKKFYNSYHMSAKYNSTPIIWSISLPIALPIIIFIIVWVRSGYRN